MAPSTLIPSPPSRFGKVGVPFVALTTPEINPERMVTESDLYRLREDSAHSGSRFIQLHTSDGQVFDFPVQGMTAALNRLLEKNPGLGKLLPNAVAIGLTADNHRELVDRCNAKAQPFPSAYADVMLDRKLTKATPSHSPRFLTPIELWGSLADNAPVNIDPRDITHRLDELVLYRRSTGQPSASLLRLHREGEGAYEKDNLGMQLTQVE